MRAARMPWNRTTPLVAATLLWLLVLGGPDLYAHVPYLRSAALGDRFAYAAALAGSWAVFVAVVAALVRLRARRPWAALALSVLFGAWVGVAVVLAIPYRVRFGQDLPASYLSFLVQNTKYGWKLFRAETGATIRIQMAIALGLIVLTIAAYVRAPHLRAVAPRSTRILGVLGALVMASTVLKKRASLPADFHATRVLLATVSLLENPGRLPTPKRAQLASVSAETRPNVLFLLGESLSADEWSPWNGATTSPGLAPFLGEHPGLVPMLRARSGASATDISVPGILTGLRSDASAADFARAPLLWHEARARGYKTALFSSQDYSWLRLGEFLLGDDAPDVVKVMKDWPDAPQVNDGAIDDALAVDAANAFLDGLPPEQPWFVVVHFNATHFPSWAPGLDAIPKAMADFTPRDSARRGKSLAYMESLQRQLLDRLAARGELDETLVLCTSDHGVGGDQTKSLARLESHYDDVVRVPLGVQLPRSYRDAHPDQAAMLEHNARELVSNVDLYPTVLDVWGTREVHGDRPTLAGSSLLRALPDRMILAMSSGPVRGWHRHGFALLHDNYKWLADDHEGLHVFDLSVDPKERVDVLDRVPASELERFRAEVRASRPLRQVVEDVAPQLLAK